MGWNWVNSQTLRLMPQVTDQSFGIHSNTAMFTLLQVESGARRVFPEGVEAVQW